MEQQNNYSPAAGDNNGPALSDNVFFGTSSFTGVTNSATANAGMISFNSGANSFTLAGANTLTIGSGGISNNAANTQTLIVSLALNAAQTWTNTSTAGTLTFGAVDLNAKDLTVGVASGSVSITGVISSTGGGGTLTKTGTGTLTLSGFNTYTGKTIINAGTVSIAATPPSAAACCG